MDRYIDDRWIDRYR